MRALSYFARVDILGNASYEGGTPGAPPWSASYVRNCVRYRIEALDYELKSLTVYNAQGYEDENPADD